MKHNQSVLNQEGQSDSFKGRTGTAAIVEGASIAPCPRLSLGMVPSPPKKVFPSSVTLQP